ncbi:hypothetical protein N7530_012919 [Penicillium desertorum]|uniref:Uncharacterized protein n=1 Tax=Penicillium desertorum TaxID=1303715 RepID=A0A9W9WDA7_9EURO|nr:hypothetical protein N7530_012919 [Penicillium desertorum]
MRPRANWPVCPPEPTAAPPITSPAPSPTPHAGGLPLYGPPTKAPGPWPPGKVAPFDPPSPPSRSANWRIRKIAISSAPSRGPLHRPPWGEGAAPKPPPPSKAEGAPPCVHPGPRASRAGFASPPLHLPSTPPAGAANSPAAPTGAPRPPFPGPRSTAGRPRPGLGEGGPPVAHGYVGTGVPGGSYREGHPARAPTVRSPAMPASLTQRNAATLADPHSLSPGPLGPGRFYTDSPTPFGV